MVSESRVLHFLLLLLLFVLSRGEKGKVLLCAASFCTHSLRGLIEHSWCFGLTAVGFVVYVGYFIWGNCPVKTDGICFICYEFS